MKKEKTKILLVEDEIINRAMITSYIDSDYDLLVAEDGEEALTLFLKEKPDVVLLDLYLPKHDGFWFIKSIKEAILETPIIVLSATDSKDEIKKVLQSGAFDFLKKPVSRSFLEISLKRAIQFKELVQKKKNHDIQEEMDKTIDVFCHDIATPLSVVISRLELIKDEFDKSGTEVRGLEQVMVSANRVGSMIKMVVQLKQVLSGKRRIELGPVSLKSAIHFCEKVFEDALVKKEVELVIKDFEDVEIMAEEMSLKNQVLNSILSNAIKYSFKGGQVILSVENKDEGVIIQIKDNGTGIPKEISQEIFSANIGKQIRGTGGEIGTGFGLSLSKIYVDKYGGKIWSSQNKESGDLEEKGTSIFLELKKSA